jgi:hypothetical protein
MRYILDATKLCGAFAIASLLAACSGGGNASGVVPQQLGAQSAQSAHVAPPANSDQSVSPQSQDESKGNCETSGKGVSVNPCILLFTLLDLQPKTVHVKANKRAEISENDDCQSKGIAALSGGPTSYTVTPGLIPGTCTAQFAAKRGTKKLGSATLTITNAN